LDFFNNENKHIYYRDTTLHILRKNTEVIRISESFVKLSKSSVTKVKKDLSGQNLFLRLYYLKGKICLGLDFRRRIDDHSCMVNDIEIVADHHSYPFIEGAYIDYIVEGIRQGFYVKSPNKSVHPSLAHSSCCYDSCCE
jgi:Fe-S cluster assembly iron-binding protein IscA